MVRGIQGEENERRAGKEIEVRKGRSIKGVDIEGSVQGKGE